MIDSVLSGKSLRARLTLKALLSLAVLALSVALPQLVHLCFGAGMGVTLLYFLVMCAFQIPDVAVFCGNFLGLFLLGAALCAIGIFISSLTESQVIAAVGSLAIGLFLLFANSFTPVVSSEWINAVMDGISFYQHYLDFTRGLLNLSDLTFFVSVTALFLFLTVRHLERRRIS